MKLKSLREIEDIVNKLAKKINALQDDLPTYGYSKDFAYPHIEIDKSGVYNYIVIERGVELERNAYHNMDDLLYRVFKSTTFNMASNYEVNNRITGQDFRRLLFAKQEELMGGVKPEWKIKLQKYHKEVLKSNPFEDNKIYPDSDEIIETLEEG